MIKRLSKIFIFASVVTFGFLLSLVSINKQGVTTTDDDFAVLMNTADADVPSCASDGASDSSGCGDAGDGGDGGGDGCGDCGDGCGG